MYLLTNEQQEYIVNELSKESSTIQQRGFDIQLFNPGDIKIAFSEVSSTFCPTRRDIFLTKVQKIIPRVKAEMVKGGFMHAATAIAFKELQNGQNKGKNLSDIAKSLFEIGSSVDNIMSILWQEDRFTNIQTFCEQEGHSFDEIIPSYINIAKEMFNYEAQRILSYHEENNRRIPKILDIEEYFDGSPLGLSKGRIDATLMLENRTIVICDLKNKPYKDNIDGKIQIAGYALAMERSLHVPVSIGCLSFPPQRFLDNEEPQRDIFIIDDNLRQDFLSRREHILSIISKGTPPPVPSRMERKCVKCSHYQSCYPLSLKQ
jgi:CRISPR-associated protein Csa1